MDPVTRAEKKLQRARAQGTKAEIAQARWELDETLKEQAMPTKEPAKGQRGCLPGLLLLVALSILVLYGKGEE